MFSSVGHRLEEKILFIINSERTQKVYSHCLVILKFSVVSNLKLLHTGCPIAHALTHEYIAETWNNAVITGHCIMSLLKYETALLFNWNILAKLMRYRMKKYSTAAVHNGFVQQSDC